MAHNKPVPEFEVARGDVVVTQRHGSGAYARVGGRASFAKGDRLEVASERGVNLSVRKIDRNGYVGNVFVIPKAFVLPEAGTYRYLGEPIETTDLSADHPGLQYLWDDAAKIATQLGFCPEYDALCEALGVPGRERSFKVDVELTEGVHVTGTETARSQKQADRQLLLRTISSTTQMIESTKVSA